ncbi:cytochrome ubiquinol oxidase subunit I [Halothiobacillus sp.]|uniref:cytochrome ubiquinol oxidase subunit I n=1 Tax=Halothiobacillus sp. TaxID=1891311 RepID=UPI00260B6F38|nr:cytochrome ubiquinol oxidase subunit I [Halothiobacillus sp.]MDD3576229.1 cytochrome ubiquinol oxidase subunit I [Halothiobacillus sp.]MDD4965512.1 cytochrome ubiquinol oxidase subunit I [Halothiobacillus sp.]MDY0147845.1 cytochrome ubiquinol oxidase subunit I [Halothiobacillus sp.]
MINDTVVELSRWQFAATALYHFLFVPLTLGLTVFLAALETVYVVTGKPIYKEMTQFWAKLLLINFALGVATGLTMEFEFGTNWSFYSGFVGDIFGAPLAVEGLMAFFMESTMIGLMIFGWDRLSRGQHLIVTYLVALGSNLSALWILVANGFMQDPQGAVFNPVTMRMELESFTALIFSHDAQAKFVHTSIAGYVTAAIFVAGVSAFYLLRKRHMELAKRSFRMATIFGVLSTIGVITLGDALGFVGAHAQPAKIAAMEAMWKTEEAPAPFNLMAWPNQEKQENSWAIQIPYLLTPLLTHTMDTKIPGIAEIEASNALRIKSGIQAVEALKILSSNPSDAAAMAQFKAHEQDLGYGFLVKRYAPEQDVSKATDADIALAAKDTIPDVFAIYWTFRIMVGFAFLMLAFFIFGVIYSLRNDVENHPLFLRFSLWLIPVPFLACEMGWLTAELGRQPWTVYNLLPTWMSASSHSVSYMVFSLIGFVSLYSIFIIIEMYLMVRAIKQGPDDHHAVQKQDKNTSSGGSVLGGNYAPVHAKTLVNEQSKEV